MILEAQGYNFEGILPETPSAKKIAGYGVHPDEQFWKRPFQLNDYQFSKRTQNEQDEIGELDMEYSKEGYWFYLRGKPFWITGDAYFFLQHYTIDGKHTDFQINQMKDFYFYKYCEVDKRCAGSIEMKPRREGCTSRKLAVLLNRAMLNENTYCGIISKKGKNAEEANFGKVVQAYNKIPQWAKAAVKLLNPSQELAFEAPAVRGKNINKQQFTDTSFWLNSKIDWRKTTSDAYDSEKLHWFIMDEYFKFEEANALKTWSTHRKVLMDGFNYIGKAFLLSTVGLEDDEDSISEEALLNGIQLWNESDPNNRTSLKETVSGLYRWFIPAQLSKRGDSPISGEPLIDKFGNMNEDEAARILLMQRNEEKDPIRKMILIRQDPMTVQEALSSTLTGIGAFGSINGRLGQRLNYLRNFVPTAERPVKYLVGNLAWKNNERLTEVVFLSNPNGRWRIPYLPTIDGIDMKNRVKKLSNGGFAPYSDTPFCLGLDPFNYSNTVSGSGSKGGMHIKHKFKNLYCAHYLERPASPDLLFENSLLTAWFWGARVNPERSGSDVFNWYKRNGVYSFIMNRPDVTKTSAFTKGDTEKGTTATPQNIELGCNLIENYFALPNEELNENDVDNLEFFWDEISIEQLMEFDKKKKEKYDAVMSMIQTEIGCQSIKKFKTNFAETGKDQRTIVDELFPEYSIINGKRVAVPRSQILNRDGYPTNSTRKSA